MVTEDISLKNFLASFITPIVQSAVREELRHLPRTDSPPHPQNRIGGIELAKEITGKAESTIYNLVSAGKIPHSKQSGKLYFSESELVNWIRQGKRKNADEVNAEVDSFLGRRGGRKQVA
ncbi:MULTISPECIES: helix-turn-helix domain-containing protein [Larkinella]|jgi:predicted DNA-binding transcriptional regulator AlpA|uniref:Helix-turn-helix domain-containing protein n=1 Tax=Larkinella humicola TaxID=2607654 RepID=A0A5N1JSU7_9BACT|nr:MULTISPECIES: helix-turn-helix domain-containing protein [Larkinella]KAA9356853.1 helix-turn-helix domain-containing protein [Larkinella humicola]